MKKGLIIALSLFLVVVVVVTAGCCKSTEEKVAEKAIESATNGAADVDIDDESVTINTNAGTWTGGEEVELPEGFPSDVHVIEGTIKTAMTITENEGYAVSIYTDKSVADAKEEYESELAADGWTINLTMSFSAESASIGAEKEGRSVAVTITTDEEENMTLVALSTSKTE